MFSDVSDHLSGYHKDWRYFTGKLIKSSLKTRKQYTQSQSVG